MVLNPTEPIDELVDAPSPDDEAEALDFLRNGTSLPPAPERLPRMPAPAQEPAPSLAAPIQDDEAERLTLGSLILAFVSVESGIDPYTTARATLERVRAILPEPEAFYSGRHQRIYRAILRLADSNVPAIPQTIRPALAQLFGADPTDADAVGDLVEALGGTSPAHAPVHAMAVRDAHTRRRIVYACAEVAQRVSTGGDVAEILSHLSTLQEAAKPVVAEEIWTTGEDIVTNLPDEERWLCRGLLRPGLITLLGADAGAGKSTLLAALANGILNGSTVIGLECSQAPSVVWVTEEARTSMREVLGPSGLATPQIHVLGRDRAFGMGWHELVAHAADKVRRTGAGLVIFDTWADLTGLQGEDENKPGPTQACMRPLKALAATGAAVCVVHHLAKSKDAKGVQRFRGSTALVGAVDAAVTLDLGGDTVRILDTAKGRGAGWVKRHRYSREQDALGGPGRYRLTFLGTAGQVAAASRGEAILEAVRAKPGMNQTEVRDAVGGGRKATILAALEELVRRSVVRVEMGGKDNATRYFPVVPA